MNLQTLIWRMIDALLKPLGYELRNRKPLPTALTMSGALGRAVSRGISAGTVIDIGAARGAWTEKALPHFPDAHYLLVEPLEERRGVLEALRAVHPKVQIVHAAAGAAPGEAVFTVADDLDGSGFYDTPAPAARAVPITTIDAEIAQRGLPPPYVLKFDTHGFELPILSGAQRTLAESSLLILEVYNFQLTARSLRFHEMCAHLETLGFRCAEIVDIALRPRDRLLWQADVFFIRADAPYFAHSSYQ